MQQRYGLSNRKILVTSRESTESTDGCHPSLSHYLPRPSRWRHAYACIAISKGNCTRARTRWLEIEQEFSPFLLKMAPYGVPACGRPFFLPPPEGRWVSKMETFMRRWGPLVLLGLTLLGLVLRLYGLNWDQG